MKSGEHCKVQKPSRRDRVLAAALAAGQLQREAGVIAGCSIATVQRRLQDPAFRRLVDQARQEIFDEVLGRAVSHASRAVEVLRDIIDDEETRPAVRVSACGRLLDTVLRYRELGELARRIDEIEELVRNSAGRSGR